MHLRKEMRHFCILLFCLELLFFLRHRFAAARPADDVMRVEPRSGRCVLARERGRVCLFCAGARGRGPFDDA
jgi:hypothetical protein